MVTESIEVESTEFENFFNDEKAHEGGEMSGHAGDENGKGFSDSLCHGGEDTDTEKYNGGGEDEKSNTDVAGDQSAVVSGEVGDNQGDKIAEYAEIQCGVDRLGEVVPKHGEIESAEGNIKERYNKVNEQGEPGAVARTGAGDVAATGEPQSGSLEDEVPQVTMLLYCRS